MKIASKPRAAFTLIELIVVLSIIALLLTLSAAVVMRLQESSKESNTNTELRKIQMKLEEQWKAAVAQIKTEDPPQGVKELTKNADGTYDIARAKAFHMKMRLRQEFPQNFGDLFSGGSVQAPNGQVYTYGAKAAFVQALKNPFQSPPGTFIDSPPESHSAALLVLILSQGRGGSTTDPESIARTKLMDFPQNPGPNGQQPPPVQLRVFADQWGNHIAFRRVADDDLLDVLAELNQPPFVAPGQVSSGNMDPQDPDGRLKLPAQYWLTPPNKPNNRITALSFLAHTGSRPLIADPFDGRNRGPYAFSAGKDGIFFNENDLYSYRLAREGKGN
jgi:prepilin-type N-terminal cleavage/methylation domain-containing protein